jgi:hypothetical protein
VNINEIVSQPSSMTSASLQYARVDEDNNIVMTYTTLQSAKYMVELSGKGYVLEVFMIRDKILAIGDIL